MCHRHDGEGSMLNRNEASRNCKSHAYPALTYSKASLAFSFQRTDFIGGRTRARTLDPLIKSQLLYQLSYAPMQSPAFPLPFSNDPCCVEASEGRVRAAGTEHFDPMRRSLFGASSPSSFDGYKERAPIDKQRARKRRTHSKGLGIFLCGSAYG
jgi:hypothetical protein